MFNIYTIYNIILIALMPLMFLYSWLKQDKLDRHSILYRFGIIPSSLKEGLNHNKPIIWIHAVSVGEINAISRFVSDLEKHDLQIVISTMTSTGREKASKNLSEVNKVIYLPFDFPWAAMRIMKLIKPDVFVTIETEIWPNILKAARKYNARVLMLNGRISPRSIGKYKKIRPLIKKTLQNYHLYSMIMPHDAERIISLGADPEKVQVNGNTKYDHLIDSIDVETADRIYKMLNIPENSRVYTAGSTRTGEEEIILDVFSKLLIDYPDLILIIVPRHIKRGNEIKEMAMTKGFDTILKTEINNGKERSSEKVIIVDTIGELFDIYSISTIVFCGASLVPKGGQNIMEPAVWGKPVLFGPSMEDFIDARDILKEAGAGIEVRNKQELLKESKILLENKELIEMKGQKGYQAVLANRGASDKNIELILNNIR